jgi:DMSO reductase anchor subunit
MHENKGRIIFFGIVFGAATGLAAALLLTRRAAKDNQSTAITAGEGFKLGVMVIGLLRAIASLGDDEPK